MMNGMISAWWLKPKIKQLKSRKKGKEKLQETNKKKYNLFLGEVLRYNLYYSLTHILKWKSFELETCRDSHYLVLNFYQINEDGEIRTRDSLVIKTLYHVKEPSQPNSLSY